MHSHSVSLIEMERMGLNLTKSWNRGNYFTATCAGIVALYYTGKCLRWSLDFKGTGFGKKKEPLPVMGLENLNVTCFLNSLLQALASCQYFQTWLSIEDKKNRLCQKKLPDTYDNVEYPGIASLYRGILAVNRNVRTELSEEDTMRRIPKDILKALKKSGSPIRTNVQQDCLELLQIIIQAITKESQRYSRKSIVGSIDPSSLSVDDVTVGEHSEKNTPIESYDGEHYGKLPGQIVGKPDVKSRFTTVSKVMPFKQITQTILICIGCGKTERKATAEVVDFISISTKNGMSGLVKSIADYYKSQFVHGVECIGCTKKFGQPIKSSFFKQTVVLRLPKILCVHVLRNTWHNKHMVKTNEKLLFTEEIHLPMQLAESYTNAEFVVEQEKMKIKPKYTLRSVIAHYGDAFSGHFVTYRKLPNSSSDLSRWFLISDDVTQEVCLASVLAAPAYMLFYERCEKNETTKKVV